MTALTSYAKRASEQRGIKTAIFGEPTNNVFFLTEDGITETHTLQEAITLIGNSASITLEQLFDLKGDFNWTWENYINQGAEIYLIDDEAVLIGSVNPFKTFAQLRNNG
jgi:hypothetical protein